MNAMTRRQAMGTLLGTQDTMLSAIGCQQAPALLFYQMIGWGFNLTAAAMEHAHLRWKWSEGLALGVIGAPGCLVSFGLQFFLMGLASPYSFYVNTDTVEGQMLLPDDGLEPFARKVIKVQVVMIFACIMAGLGSVFMRDGEQ